MNIINDDNEIVLAGKPDRLINYAVDTFIIIITSILFSIFFMFTYPVAFESSYLAYLLFAIISFLYYSIFEISSGKTLGKIFTKTKVINRHNKKPNIFNILIRSLTRLFFFDMHSYLFGYEIGMHDLLSNTLVIKDK